MGSRVKAVFVALLVSLLSGLVFAQDGWNVNLVNEFTHNWRDGVVDLAYRDNILYMACDNAGMRIVATPDAVQPGFVELAHYDCLSATAIDIAGNYAYVGCSGEGFQVIDISIPNNPVLVTQIPELNSYYYAIKVIGQNAFVCTSRNGIEIFDISNPASASLIWSSYPSPSFARDVDVKNDRMYITCGQSGIRIFDISNINSPQLLQSINPGNGDTYEGIAVSGNYAYLALGEIGFQVLDLTTTQRVAGLNNLAYATKVQLRGDYAYLGYGSPECPLAIINISDPLAPVVTGIYTPPEDLINFRINGSTVFVADNYHGLRQVDIGNPTNPVETARYNMWGHDLDIEVLGDLAYIREEHKLDVINVNDPANPALIDYYEVPGQYEDFAILGNTAYFAQSSDTPLIAVNISDPSLMTTAGYYTSGYVSNFNDIAMIDNNDARYACVTHYSGIKVIDVSNPLAMQEVGDYSRDLAFAELESYGNYIITEDRGYNLFVLNVSDPTTPILAGSCPIHEQLRDMKVYGNWLYVVTDRNFLIFNLDSFTPWEPTCETTLFYSPQKCLRGIDVRGNFAYIVGDSIGLKIYDISDRANPQIAGSAPVDGYFNAVGAKDDYVIVSNHFGLNIYEFVVASGIGDNDSPLPKSVELLSNYPNPFNSATMINFAVPKQGQVKIAIYDILGREVVTLADREFAAGNHAIRWDGVSADGSPAVSGRYYVRAVSDKDCQTIPVTLLK